MKCSFPEDVTLLRRTKHNVYSGKKVGKAVDESINVKLLGVRGSLPVNDAAFMKYGGATSCLFIEAGGEIIFLDAGTGILTCPELPTGKRISILVTHSHIDHILGFPMCPFIYDESYEVNLYLSTREGRDAKAQISALMSNPLWPAGIESVRAKLTFHDVPETFEIGGIMVDSMESSHPGGSTIYKLTAGGKSLVYATDFEHDDYNSGRLAAFAQDCSILIYDSQFLDCEYGEKRGWGHSTYEEGIKMGASCGAGVTVFFHHDPTRTDAQLDEIAKQAEAAEIVCRIGRCGEEITI